MTRTEILAQTDCGLSIYGLVLGKIYPGETVISMNGWGVELTKNPFNQNRKTLKIMKERGEYQYFDIELPAFRGGPFDFAALHYHLRGEKLDGLIARELGLEPKVVMTPKAVMSTGDELRDAGSDSPEGIATGTSSAGIIPDLVPASPGETDGSLDDLGMPSGIPVTRPESLRTPQPGTIPAGHPTTCTPQPAPLSKRARRPRINKPSPVMHVDVLSETVEEKIRDDKAKDTEPKPKSAVTSKGRTITTWAGNSPQKAAEKAERKANPKPRGSGGPVIMSMNANAGRSPEKSSTATTQGTPSDDPSGKLTSRNPPPKAATAIMKVPPKMTFLGRPLSYFGDMPAIASEGPSAGNVAARNPPPAPIFTFFRAPIRNVHPLNAITLVDVYNLIRSPKYEKQTMKLREAQSPEEARKLKAAKFDYVTFSGVFSTRKDDALVKHSGLMTIDFDHVPDVKKLREQLIDDEYFITELLFVSPSGDGLKWIIPVDLYLVSHQMYFSAVAAYIRKFYGLDVDKSGRDISRACFLPYDPEVYINPKYLPNER